MAYVKYAYQALYDLGCEMFRRYGYNDSDSKKITDVVLTSDLYGIESHGVNRLTLYPFGIDIGRIKVDAEMKIVEETATGALIDAGDGMGQLAGIMGMELAIKKAKESGVGLVSVRNSNHYGIAGYYSMMAAKEHLMGVSMTNAEALVVPTYGRQPMLGTNPIAVTMPAEPFPFHMDFATSIMTAGKMEVYAKRGATLKSGMLVDEDGRSSTDPNTFLKIRRDKTMGGIMPMGGEGMLFGGHKGYALGMLVDILTGIFAGGAVSTQVRVKPHLEKCGHFFAAIDYGMFGDKKAIEERMTDYLQGFRDALKAEGQTRIFVPGDKESDSERDVMLRGVGVNEATMTEIRTYCGKLGIDVDSYLKPLE
jgi:LDH2 family malate/lactate/ureidoglycolate dehydrogenase